MSNRSLHNTTVILRGNTYVVRYTLLEGGPLQIKLKPNHFSQYKLFSQNLRKAAVKMGKVIGSDQSIGQNQFCR